MEILIKTGYSSSKNKIHFQLLAKNPSSICIPTLKFNIILRLDTNQTTINIKNLDYLNYQLWNFRIWILSCDPLMWFPHVTLLCLSLSSNAFSMWDSFNIHEERDRHKSVTWRNHMRRSHERIQIPEIHHATHYSLFHSTNSKYKQIVGNMKTTFASKTVKTWM